MMLRSEKLLLDPLDDMVDEYIPKCKICNQVYGVEHKHEYSLFCGNKYDLCGYHCLESRDEKPLCSECDSQATCVTMDHHVILCDDHSYDKVVIRFGHSCMNEKCRNRSSYTCFNMKWHCSIHKESYEFLNVKDRRLDIKSNIKCYDCTSPIEYMISCSCNIKRCMACAYSSCWIIHKNKIIKCSQCHNVADNHLLRHNDIGMGIYFCSKRGRMCSNHVTIRKDHNGSEPIHCLEHSPEEEKRNLITNTNYRCVMCLAWAITPGKLCRYHNRISAIYRLFLLTKIGLYSRRVGILLGLAITLSYAYVMN